MTSLEDPQAHPFGSLYLQLDSCLDALTLYTASLEVHHPGQSAIDLFQQFPLLPGLILKQQGELVGVLPRQRFFEVMSRPLSLEQFAPRPLTLLCQSIPMVVQGIPSSTPIAIAVAQALERPPETLYDPLLVTFAPGDYRLVDIHDLLLAQVQIHHLAQQALQDSQQALVAEKELAQITLQSIGDGVVTTDAQGRVKSLNQVAERLTGWGASQAFGLPLTQVLRWLTEAPEGDPPEPAAGWSMPAPALNPGLDLNPSTGMLTDRHGHQRIIDYSVSPIEDGQGQCHGAVWILRDITQQCQLTSQIRWQASHDALTGLINRIEFERLLQQASQSMQPEAMVHTLCYLDLDRFKIVNDTCGHLAGDELLRQVSSLLQSQVSHLDAVARLGGDEFGILLYGCPIDRGLVLADGIREAIHQFRFSWQGHTFAIGVSIGLTTVNGHCPVTELLRQGDSACYWAKHRGRGQVCQYRQVERTFNADLSIAWVTRLSRALEVDHFCLHRQKIVDAETLANILSYELLLRLPGEGDQTYLPGSFLPAAERYDLMPEIDRWVIRHAFQHHQEACRQAAASQNPPLCHLACGYAINLSEASLNDTQLVTFIKTALADYAIPPGLICFEITETVAITNLTQARTILAELKQLGCRLALDDFGGGMSSFSYLKQLPLDYLKIDGHFIQTMTTDPVTRAMVESIHRVGQVMGLQTIAESVDSPAILACLQEMGVNYVQGYFIEQPQPFIARTDQPGADES